MKEKIIGLKFLVCATKISIPKVFAGWFANDAEECGVWLDARAQQIYRGIGPARVRSGRCPPHNQQLMVHDWHSSNRNSYPAASHPHKDVHIFVGMATLTRSTRFIKIHKMQEIQILSPAKVSQDEIRTELS